MIKPPLVDSQNSLVSGHNLIFPVTQRVGYVAMDEQTQTTGAEQGSAAVDPGEQALNPDEEITEIEKLLEH